MRRLHLLSAFFKNVLSVSDVMGMHVILGNFCQRSFTCSVSGEMGTVVALGTFSFCQCCSFLSVSMVLGNKIMFSNSKNDFCTLLLLQNVVGVCTLRLLLCANMVTTQEPSTATKCLCFLESKFLRWLFISRNAVIRA